MDEESIKKAGLSPILPILERINAFFSEQAINDENKALSNTFAFLWSIGLEQLFGAGIGADDKDPDTVVVSLWPARIGLPSKEYYGDDAVTSKYQSVLSEVLSSIFPSKSIPDSTFHSVIEFEKQVASVTPDNEDMNDVTVSMHDIVKYTYELMCALRSTIIPRP